MLVHGVLHLAGYDHETDEGEMLGPAGPARRGRRAAALASRATTAERPPPRRGGAARQAGRLPRPDDRPVVQLRVRGDHLRAPHPAEHADPLRAGAAIVLVLGLACWGEQARAAGADRRHLVRADRGDDEHGARGGDRHRHDVVRPAGQDRQGRRRRRRADRRGRTRIAIAYLVFADHLVHPSTRLISRRAGVAAQPDSDHADPA